MGGDTRALARRAQAVLDANWTGASTVASRSLYPHQWSWDAAFIAIGRSWSEQGLAQQELESLLGAQWANGMVPHIVFNPDVPAGAYFPGPDFWDADRADGHPGAPHTSGITQPPLHARAALEVWEHAADRTEARAFLERVYPRLVAQHDYLASWRDLTGHGLAAIVHPWESGLDNSPLWDRDLDELDVPPGVLPAYQRFDLVHAEAADRPTDAAYDRFVYLAMLYRDADYDDAKLLAISPFLVEDPLFNSIWCWSAHALAQIARVLGDDPAAQLALAGRIHRGLAEHLWDPGERRFHARDVRQERWLRKDTITSLAPLLDPGLPAEQAAAVVAELDSPRFHPDGPAEHFLVPSFDLTSPSFDPRRYWRGPVWINTDWLLWRGLLQHGTPAVAAEIAASMVALVRRSGFREYFDPYTGSGYGSDGFSWTAALLLDLLHRSGAAAAG